MPTNTNTEHKILFINTIQYFRDKKGSSKGPTQYYFQSPDDVKSIQLP